MYTWRHLLWIVISISFVLAAVYGFKRKRTDMERVFTIALIIAILSELTKIAGVIRLVPSHNQKLLLPYIPPNHLPLHFCSIQIILIAIAKFMKNEKRREPLLAFMAPTCVLGGIRRQGTVLCLPQTASADMARFIEIVMGVGIVAGTVIEDFGTGGVGIADDLASFLIAQKLILGY